MLEHLVYSLFFSKRTQSPLENIIVLILVWQCLSLVSFFPVKIIAFLKVHTGFLFLILQSFILFKHWESTLLIIFYHSFLSSDTGVRVVHADWYPGHAASGVRDRTRVHLCDAQAAADDHVGSGQGTNPDMSKLTRSTERGGHGWPEDERDRIRRDGAQLQYRRRGLQSKAIGVRPSRARSFRASTGGGRRSLWPGPKLDAADIRWRGRRPVTVVAPAAIRDPRTLASFAHTAPARNAYDPCTAVNLLIEKERERESWGECKCGYVRMIRCRWLNGWWMREGLSMRWATPKWALLLLLFSCYVELCSTVFVFLDCCEVCLRVWNAFCYVTS